MSLILGIVVLIVWVVYRATRPSQFRVIELDGEYYLEIKGWLTGIWWDAYAYGTQYSFLLSIKPTIMVNYEGCGFNYGSNNIIENCPKRILICAEDD